MPINVQPATATQLGQLLNVCFKIAPTDTPVFDDDIYTIVADEGSNYYLKNIVCRLTALAKDVNETYFEYGLLFCNRLHIGRVFYSQLLPTTYTRQQYFETHKTKPHEFSYKTKEPNQTALFNAHA